MMLDDFFTLTEINNGLTVPSRVKELVAVMQEQRDSAVMNVGEASRQWSAVGSAIAATENQECLDLFVHLDGLHSISKWLKDAQKLNNNSSDSFLEESVVHLLQALRKLHVDYEKLVAADIWTSLNELLVHNNPKVKAEAQVLIESWKKKRDGDEFRSDVETVGVMTDDVGKSASIVRGSGHFESSQKDDSLSKETSYKEKNQESTRDDPMLSASSDIVHPGHVLDEAFECSVKDNPPSNHASSPSLLKPAMELPSSQSIDAFSVESCNPATSREDTLDGRMEFNELESVSDKKHSPKIVESLPDKSEAIEEINSSEPFPASSDVAEATKSVTEPGPQEPCEPGNKSLSDEGSLCVGSRKTDSDGKCSMDQCRNSSDSTEEGGEYRTLCKSSGPEKSWGNKADLGASRSVIEDHGKVRKFDLHASGDNLVKDYKFSKKELHREPDRTYRKSDVDLYGIIDPLEVARQVAREVEREVVDYREQSCSSSDKLPVDNVQQPGSPDSVSGKQSSSSEGSPNEVENNPDLSGEASAMEEESETSIENLDAEQTNGMQDMETSQVTEAAQEEVNTERGPCNFDLNLEVCSEDADRSAEQLLTPVSIVSASRAAAPPGLPVAPLQFEGNLGWKGSAATSAFRPASPRRLPENEKDISTVGNSNNSKQQQRFLDIDLNVAESVDGGAGYLPPNNNSPLYSSIPSGESSVVTNPRISERLGLDLNLTSEDGAHPADWQMGHLFSHANGPHSWSHSFPSSSKQPSFKNFDLNDRPLFLNDQSDNTYLSKLSQSCNVTGGIKSDESAISIMGTRVEVSRKNLTSPNGRPSELAFDANLARSGSFMGTGTVLPYAHSSAYSCNNIVPGPAMPFSSAIYGSVGPIPYIMDSRAPPVLPHIVGSPSALPAGFTQTPFFINMTNQTPSNGAGAGASAGAGAPSWSSFDLNSGTIAEGGSRENAGCFLNSGRSMDEQLRSNTQLTISSVVNGKRKEPDNGLEQYPLRHYTPPWK
ncbi:hypothetical protein C2S51_038357 [Perilla frutescens var. frutescens]|nr:hypothetical protein C2S51_038357 [Perilla frutescens var. frutescens]